VSPHKGQKLIPESERKKHQINVRLTDQEIEKLSEISKREGWPIAQIARQGIAVMIKRYSRKH